MRTFAFAAVMIFAAGVAGCASQSGRRDRALDDKIAAEAPADSPERIAERAAEAFASAPGVSREGKDRLIEIYLRTYRDATVIRTEIGKAKSLLFRTVASKGYASAEVESLKKKIVELDQRRLQAMFRALTDVQDVVGYGTEAEPAYRHFHQYEFPQVDRAPR